MNYSNSLKNLLDHKHSICPILEKITNHIVDYILKKDEIKRLDSLGVYNGEFGLFLYLYLYNEQFPNKAREEVLDLFIEQLLDQWSYGLISYSYCGGTVGILDLFHYLEENNICSIDLEGVSDGLEDHLAIRMIEDISIGDYDFLHNSLGIAYYLLNKNIKLDSIREFIHQLRKSAIREKDTYKWPFFNIDNNKTTYNISLSHGISSIIVFLSEAYKKGLCTEESADLMLGCASYILNQKFDGASENQSLFPAMSKDNSSAPSRLGWCYGDLGIAVALCKMGESLNIKTYEDIAFDIVNNATNRTDLNLNMIRDAGICHGSAGVAMMFQFFMERFKSDRFNELRDYWLTETVKMIPITDNKILLDKWCADSYDLLTGISGIGLVLLSHITGNFSWKRLFLLK